MKLEQSSRGFYWISHAKYLDPADKTKLVSESSAIGDYDDSFDRPGSSFLWVGSDHHLNREEVAELAEYLKEWLKNGRLAKEALAK